MRTPPRIIVAGWIVWVLACGGSTPPPQPASSLPKLNPSARIACQKFTRVLQELKDGVLTDAELRPRLREIYDTARLEPSEVATASTALLREVTDGTTESAFKSMGAMSEACRDWANRR